MAFINWGNQTPEERAAMAKRRLQEEQEMMYEAMRNSVRQSASAPGPSVLGGGAIAGITPEILLNRTALAASLEYNGATSGPSGQLTFTLTGLDLQGAITVTAPTHFEICKTVNGTYADTLTFAQTDGDVAEQSVYVQLKDNVAVGDYTETISVTSTGAKTKTVTCIGKVWQPVLTTGTSGLTGLNGTTSAAGTAQSFTVAGSHLVGASTVSVSWNNNTDFELSTTSGIAGFTSSTINLTAESGTNTDNNIAGGTKTIWVRMKSGGSTGAKTGTITIAATDATSKTVTLAGTKS